MPPLASRSQEHSAAAVVHPRRAETAWNLVHETGKEQETTFGDIVSRQCLIWRDSWRCCLALVFASSEPRLHSALGIDAAGESKHQGNASVIGLIELVIGLADVFAAGNGLRFRLLSGSQHRQDVACSLV